MKKIPFILLILLSAVIAVATFVEDAHGTDVAADFIYHAWWFRLLWLLLAVSGAVVMWKQKMFRNLPVCLLHVSFLIILIGAGTTALTSHQGYVHLRPHEPTRMMYLEDESQLTLPFTLELDTFRISYYPGTDAPSDYASVVTCTDGERQLAAGTISMNNIMSVAGYRLYQSSFDDDQQGTWLTATYDPYGTSITYVGYLLLALSAVLVLLGRRQGFVRLLHHPALRRGSMLMMLLPLMLTVQTVRAQTAASPMDSVLASMSEDEADSLRLLMQQMKQMMPPKVKPTAWDGPLPVIPRSEADKLKTRQMVFNSRIVPFNTLAVDFVQKLHGKTSFNGLSAEQVIVSWQQNPKAWRNAKILKISAKNRVLTKRLGLKGKYISVNDLYDAEGEYKLRPIYEVEYGTHSKLEKAIVDIDERIGIIKMLENGTLIVPIPDDGSVEPLSESKVKAELLYNAVPVSKILFMANLTLGFLLFFFMLWRMMKGQQTCPAVSSLETEDRGQRMASRGFVVRIAYVLLIAATLFQLFGYCLRWYVSGTVPLTNGYETMQFVALATLVITCLLARRFSFVLPFGFLISGFTLLVSYLGQMNPQITSLMPVLQSPWLSSHVSLIMISYSLFAFITLNAVVALIVRRSDQIETLTVLSRLLLYPAVLLLAVGIFLGAVWANVSWGNYWSWDPKEVWALVTMLLYGLAFHRQSLAWLRSPRRFHLYMLFCFLSVLMTYFGVNYLLGGMHSYAN